MKKKELYLFGMMGKESESFPKEWNWEYCLTNKIPYILVSLKDEPEFSHVKVDLDTINDGLIFEDSTIISDNWQRFYMEYCKERQIPDDKRSFIGSNSSFGITIRSVDTFDFVPAFHNYIMKIVKKYGKIDNLLAIYTKIHRRRNLMTMREIPYNKEEFDQLGKQQIELRYKIWDNDFNKKTDYEKGRITPFE